MSDFCMNCGKDESLRDVEVTQGQQTETVCVCSDTCEKELQAFVVFVERRKFHFFGGLLGIPLVGTLVTFLTLPYDSGALGMLTIMGGMGATVIKYPFVTPQTLQLARGIQRATKLGKILGVVLILMGVVAAVLMYLYLPRPE
jgi:hypothetical protein